MERIIPDNKNERPLAYYMQQFQNASPDEMSMRSGFFFDPTRSAFQFHFLGQGLWMTYPDMEVKKSDDTRIETPAIRILLARALLTGKVQESSGRYLAYAEVPWGNVYLQQFTGRCVSRLAFGFGRQLDVFERACLALGGVPCAGADKGFTIEFLDGLHIRLLIWAPDEECPPSAQILFSDTSPFMYTAEDLAVVGDVLINALKTI